MRIAIRLSKSFYQKRKNLILWYHVGHDWYLAANHKSKKFGFSITAWIETIRCSKRLSGTVIPFRYNNKSDFENIIKKNIKIQLL